MTGRLTGPIGRSEDVRFLVDTGSMLLGLPRALADRLELVPELNRRVTTPCYIVPTGTPLLGAVALQSLFLGVDPVDERLVPIEARI